MNTCLAAVFLLLAALPLAAQTIKQPNLHSTAAASAEPTSPAPQDFHDSRSGVSFHLPAGWNLSRTDGELSTFDIDARTAAKNTQMRAVANLAFNPFPYSTFTGAFFYFSQTPRSTEAQCRQQASAPAPRTTTTAQVGGIPFAHGYDEHGQVCTEARDEVYTALRNNTCYRFDLLINTFCGGDPGGGARDISPRELELIRQRLESILSTVKFDSK